MAKERKPIKTKLTTTAAPGTDTQTKSNDDSQAKTMAGRIHPKSYKLTASDVRRLDKLVRDVGAVASFKVKEVNVIKGLIFLGSKMKNKERIANAYKESL